MLKCPSLLVGRYRTPTGLKERHMAPESFSLVNVYRMYELGKGRKVGQKGIKLPKLCRFGARNDSKG